MIPEGLKFVVQQKEEPSEKGCATTALSFVGAIGAYSILMDPGISIDAHAGFFGGYVESTLLTDSGACMSQTGLDAYFVPADPTWNRAINHYGVTWAAVTSLEPPCVREDTGLYYCYELFLSNMTKIGEWSPL